MTSSQDTTAVTYSQDTTAVTSSQDTMAVTSSQDTTAVTSSQWLGAAQYFALAGSVLSVKYQPIGIPLTFCQSVRVAVY